MNNTIPPSPRYTALRGVLLKAGYHRGGPAACVFSNETGGFTVRLIRASATAGGEPWPLEILETASPVPVGILAETIAGMSARCGCIEPPMFLNTRITAAQFKWTLVDAALEPPRVLGQIVEVVYDAI